MPAADEEILAPARVVCQDGWPQTAVEFEVLVEAFQDRLVAYAFARLRNLADAEDVVQDVFVTAFVRRARLRRVDHVGPYLYRMVANACTDALRRRKRRGISLEDVPAAEIPSTTRNPSHAAAAAQEMRRVEDLLQCLPARQAEVVRLRVVAELPLAEIAQVVGCPVATAKSRLRYGLAKLRKLIPEKGGAER